MSCVEQTLGQPCTEQLQEQHPSQEAHPTLLTSKNTISIKADKGVVAGPPSKNASGEKAVPEMTIPLQMNLDVDTWCFRPDAQQELAEKGFEVATCPPALAEVPCDLWISFMRRVIDANSGNRLQGMMLVLYAVLMATFICVPFAMILERRLSQSRYAALVGIASDFGPQFAKSGVSIVFRKMKNDDEDASTSTYFEFAKLDGV